MKRWIALLMIAAGMAQAQTGLWRQVVIRDGQDPNTLWGPQWVGTAASQLNMNNFGITNVGTLSTTGLVVSGTSALGPVNMQGNNFTNGGTVSATGGVFQTVTATGTGFVGNGSGVTNAPEQIVQLDLSGYNGFVIAGNYLSGFSVLANDTDAYTVSGFKVNKAGTYKLYMIWQQDTANSGKTMSGKVYVGTVPSGETISWNILGASNLDIEMSAGPAVTTTEMMGATSFAAGEQVGCYWIKDDNAGGALGNLFVHGWVLVRQ